MKVGEGTTHEQSGARKIGKYEVIAEIGRGGMAELLLATLSGPAGFAKKVALKRVLPEHTRSLEFTQMFLAEAELAARLSHPNVVQVFDFGETDGNYFLAMEYLEGTDLRALMRGLGEGATLPPVVAAQIVAGAAEGLHYAHTLQDQNGNGLNLVHRDVTPSNLFVTRQGVTKLLDFGVARTAQSQNHTRAGVLKGKIPYLSPEQIHGVSVDARSDVWGLGVVLYEILAGRRPFEGDSDFKVLSAIVAAPIRPPSEFNRDVPAELNELVLAALQRDMDTRLASADVLRQRLARFVRKHSEDSGVEEVARFLAKATPLVRSAPVSPAPPVESPLTRAVPPPAAPVSTPTPNITIEPESGGGSSSSGSSSRASKTLIATLSAQHVTLKHSAVQLGAAIKAGNFTKARDLLTRFEKVLTAHQKLEDSRLYPELTTLAKRSGQEDLIVLAEQFSESMRGVMEVVTDFVTRAKGPTGDKVIASEWPGVAEALAARVSAEEDTLYPMHKELAEGEEVRGSTSGA